MTAAKISDPPQTLLTLKQGRTVSITDVSPPLTDSNPEFPVIVALHGMLGSVYDFRYIAAHFEEKCRVVRIDFPGNMRTHEKAVVGDAADSKNLALLVHEVCQHLQIKNAWLLGHSLGCQIAMICAEQYPKEFAGLILVNPAPGLKPHKGIRPVRLHTGLTKLHHFFDKTIIRPLWRRVLRRLWIFGGGWPARVKADEIAFAQRRMAYIDHWNQKSRCQALHKARLPVMMAWSKNDRQIEASVSKELSEALPEGPRLVFSDGGHHCQKHHAAAIAERALQFIANKGNEAGATPAENMRG